MSNDLIIVPQFEEGTLKISDEYIITPNRDVFEAYARNKYFRTKYEKELIELKQIDISIEKIKYLKIIESEGILRKPILFYITQQIPKHILKRIRSKNPSCGEYYCPKCERINEKKTECYNCAKKYYCISCDRNYNRPGYCQNCSSRNKKYELHPVFLRIIKNYQRFITHKEKIINFPAFEKITNNKRVGKVKHTFSKCTVKITYWEIRESILTLLKETRKEEEYNLLEPLFNKEKGTEKCFDKYLKEKVKYLTSINLESWLESIQKPPSKESTTQKFTNIKFKKIEEKRLIYLKNYQNNLNRKSLVSSELFSVVKNCEFCGKNFYTKIKEYNLNLKYCSGFCSKEAFKKRRRAFKEMKHI